MIAAPQLWSRVSTSHLFFFSLENRKKKRTKENAWFAGAQSPNQNEKPKEYKREEKKKSRVCVCVCVKLCKKELADEYTEKKKGHHQQQLGR